MRVVRLQHRLPAITARQQRCRCRRGFTLIEAALTTVIIGVGVLALLQLLAAGTMSNVASTKLTTATNLANNINEWSLRLRYDELRDAFNNKTFDPPKDALGNNLPDFSGWTQVVDVHYVDPNRITLAVADTQVEPTSRVSVRIEHNGKMIHETCWLVTASEWPPPP
jgi:Tfp pilus assembly protein PilV